MARSLEKYGTEPAAEGGPPSVNGAGQAEERVEPRERPEPERIELKERAPDV